MKARASIKKIAAAVMSVALLFSSTTFYEDSRMQQIPLVAEAADYNYCNGRVLEAPKGESAQMQKNKLYFSPLKNYCCIFEPNGELSIYRYRSWIGPELTSANKVWSTDTKPYLHATCKLQVDGNLVIRNNDDTPLFHTATPDKNRKKTTYLCLSRAGELYVKRNGDTLWGSWDGIEYKHRKTKDKQPEPKEVKWVGEWKTPSEFWSTGLPYNHTCPKITIDFPKDGKIKVTFDKVLYIGQDNEEATININSCEEVGNNKYSYKVSRPYSNKIDSDFTWDNTLKFADDGETLWLGSHKFKRVYTH